MPTRLIRDGILTSDRVCSLSWESEVFYRRLMSVADDYGLYDARPAILRSALYPLQLDKMSECNIQRSLAACETAGLILLFSVDGKSFLQIKDFRQQAKSKAKFPFPNDTIRDEPSRSVTIRDESSPSATNAESESDTNINNSHPYSEKPDLSVCVPLERLHPHSDSEAFAIFMKAICDLRPAWAKVAPNGGEQGLARELYEAVKGSIKPSDMLLLKAYLNDVKVAQDRNKDKFWRPENRKYFLENFAGTLASAERWKKETRWKPFKAPVKKVEQPEKEANEPPASVEDFRKLLE